MGSWKVSSLRSSKKVLMQEEEVFQKLREQGMRITQLRRQLVKFILSQEGHWHIQDLAEKIMKKFPKVGIATIYRTVNLLAEEGILSKSDVGSGPARYETTPNEHHDHLNCLDCGAIFEFENDKIEELQTKVAKQLGFKLKDHHMELYGSCQNRSKCKYRKSRARS